MIHPFPTRTAQQQRSNRALPFCEFTLGIEGTDLKSYNQSINDDDNEKMTRRSGTLHARPRSFTRTFTHLAQVRLKGALIGGACFEPLPVPLGVIW